MLFLAADCPPCRELADDLRRSAAALRSRLVIVLEDGEATTKLVEGVDAIVLYQHRHEISGAFMSMATPHAFVIDRSGIIIAAGTPSTLSNLRQLAHSIEGEEVSAEVQEPDVVSV